MAQQDAAAQESARNGWTDRAVYIVVVTNSLASDDVPAVYSEYKKWRRPVLERRLALPASPR